MVRVCYAERLVTPCGALVKGTREDRIRHHYACQRMRVTYVALC